MTVRAGELGYWLVAIGGVVPGDDVEIAIRTMLGGAPQAALDGFAELLSYQRPYAPAWHTYNGQPGFVVIATVADEANQRASANILSLMTWMLQNGATIITPMPLAQAEAAEQFLGLEAA